jgi:uncharacterized protein involved in exopolysaccharide biosynthesis
MSDLQKFARKKGIMAGLIEPSDEEKALMEQQAPDPQAQLTAAKAEEAHASAQLKTAQAQAVGGPEAAPKVPDGLEAAHKVAQVAKTVAETHKLETDTAHSPQRLAIEATNAQTNREKAAHQGALARFKAMFSGGR